MSAGASQPGSRTEPRPRRGDGSPADAVRRRRLNQHRRTATTVERGPVFVKTGDATACEMFAAEAAGLNALAQTQTVRTPKVLAVGACGAGRIHRARVDRSWFGDAHERSGARRAARVAASHDAGANSAGGATTRSARPRRRTRRAPIGSMFLRERRLRYQLDLAGEPGRGRRTARSRGAAVRIARCVLCGLSSDSRRCCTAISGAATGAPITTDCPWCLTRRCISEIAKRTSP